MSAELIPFAFEEHLVRVVQRNDEAWFVGRDICHALELGNESKALGTLDADERANGVTISDPMGREQSVVVISEPGVYRLVFRSRKPSAERFKRWLAHDVLPQLRRTGRYETASPLPPLDQAAAAGPDADPRTWPVIQKLQCVQLAARIHGRARAEPLWRALGLPPVPPPPLTARDEARQCLRHLLDAPVHEGAETSIRDAIEAALATTRRPGRSCSPPASASIRSATAS